MQPVRTSAQRPSATTSTPSPPGSPMTVTSPPSPKRAQRSIAHRHSPTSSASSGAGCCSLCLPQPPSPPSSKKSHATYRPTSPADSSHDLLTQNHTNIQPTKEFHDKTLSTEDGDGRPAPPNILSKPVLLRWCAARWGYVLATKKRQSIFAPPKITPVYLSQYGTNSLI